MSVSSKLTVSASAIGVTVPSMATVLMAVTFYATASFTVMPGCVAQKTMIVRCGFVCWKQSA